MGVGGVGSGSMHFQSSMFILTISFHSYLLPITLEGTSYVWNVRNMFLTSVNTFSQIELSIYGIVFQRVSSQLRLLRCFERNLICLIYEQCRRWYFNLHSKYEWICFLYFASFSCVLASFFFLFFFLHIYKLLKLIPLAFVWIFIINFIAPKLEI